MEDEKWISLNAFMKLRKIGYDTAMDMIEKNEVEYRKTSGGRYRIKVGGNAVSREIYEKEKERRIQAETTLEMLKTIINKGVKTNENI
ncbi:MAG: hypothetical protein IJ220_07935 [Clostridia bacterium]|nr:hypothetical protein [Clostridia bacterium]